MKVLTTLEASCSIVPTGFCVFQAQTEIQAMMEENTYPLFLKSDLYLEYTRTGGESPKPNPSDQSPSSGPAKPVPGYLPTLAEDEEWRYDGVETFIINII